ncbi:SecY-interacting protein [Thalassotalea aquiviva]|uniref:SecY-interacting protein n=1 Tax=Thalassotalea aquiviva TaxID=3242415 RepID=UPI00352ADBDB
MSASQPSLSQNLDTFLQQFVQHSQNKTGSLPLVEADEQWPSPCEVGEPSANGMVQWQPAKFDSALSFDNVEKALELRLHDDIKTYFCHCFAESVPATAKDGNLELLFAWSADDFERLQKNVIGHVLMKQKLKQQVTVFFAVTDEEDINLVINNDSGEVWTEAVGCEPSHKVSDSLAEFIAQLSPL